MIKSATKFHSISSNIRNFSAASVLLSLLLGMNAMPLDKVYAGNVAAHDGFNETVNTLFMAPSHKHASIS